MNLAKWIGVKTHPLATDLGILVLRASFGLTMLLAHGWGKLMSFGERSSQFPDPLGVGSAASMALAVFAEVFCSLGLITGTLTRLALVPLITTMVVAFFVIHAADPFQRKELALVYLLVYLVLMLTGPGRFSLDALAFGRTRR